MIYDNSSFKYIDELISKSPLINKYILVSCNIDVANSYIQLSNHDLTLLANKYILSSPFGLSKNLYLLGIPDMNDSLVSYSKLTKEQFDNVIYGYNTL